MKKELKNPKKADLNKDGQLSGYEKKRGMAIEEAMGANLGKFIKEKKAEKNFKKELKKGKVDIKGDKGGKKLSTYVMEKRNEPKIPEFLQRQKNAPVAGLSKNKNLAKVLGKTMGVIGILTPSELGSAELKDMEKKKYGGPVGVKMAKGGFKKKTPIY
tara:strand:- start:1440 stop:1913 length:474 start_codon:yes stop_codon:yes gene_type:complete